MLAGWGNGALALGGDGVLVRWSPVALEGCLAGAVAPAGWISLRLLRGDGAADCSGDLSLPPGGAERPLASAGLEDGVPGWSRSGRGWLAVSGCLERRLEERCWPGGPRGRRLDVRQERRGDCSGDESHCGGALVSSDILGEDVWNTWSQDESGPRSEDHGLIKGRLENSAGLAL